MLELSAVEGPGGKVQGDKRQGEGGAHPTVATALMVNVGFYGLGATPVVYPWPCPPGLAGQPP